jgi:CDP-glycerol glycerophosphotransferase (TagB/SpsB family)
MGTLTCPSSYVTALSRLGAVNRCAEFGVTPREVLIVGSPRNDVLVRTDRQSVRDRLGLADSTRLLVWLSTSRNTIDAASIAQLDTLRTWLKHNSAMMIVKPHPLASRPAIATDDRLCLIDEGWLRNHEITLYELLAASDGLITDFSSVWIDYLLTERPIWIHWPDHQQWTERQLLPLEPHIEWIPGPLTTEVDDLVAELSHQLGEDCAEWDARRRWLLAVLHRYRDANATDRLLERLGLLSPTTDRIA